MTHKLHLSVLASAVIMAQMSYAMAEEVLETSNVEVTATRTEKNLLDVPSSVSVITAEDIQKSGKATIGDVLQDITGVQINNDGSQGLKRISIRGESAFRTVILVDGQKISEHKSMSGTAILIAPSEVERIEVIKGASSVLFGSDAIGGVVNIITKKGAGKPLNLDVGATFDSSNKGWTENAAFYGSKNGFKYRLGFSHTETEDIHTPVGQIDSTDFSQHNYDGFLSYDFTDNFTLGIKANRFDSNINATSYGMDNFAVKIPKWRREKVSLFADWKNISELFTKAHLDVYYQNNNKYMNNIVGSANMVSIADNMTKTVGTNVQTEWQLGESNYAILGFAFDRDELLADNNLTMSPSPVVSIASHTHIRGHQSRYAGFLSIESELPADVLLNYGLRYTYVSSRIDTYSGTSTRTMMGKTVTSPAATQDGDTSDDKVVFNAGIVWEATDDLSLRANWGQGFRAPILQEKFVVSSMGGGTVYGNKDLSAEKSNNYEVGFRWIPDNAYVDWTLFYNDAKDYIAAMTIDAATNTSQYRNIAGVKTYGSELSARYAFDFGLEPYTETTFMRRQYDDASTIGKTWNTNTPALMSRYGLKYNFDINGVKINADIFGRSHTKRKEDYSSSGAVATRAHGGFTTANFELGVAFGKENLYNVNLGVYNIFDKYYYVTDAIPEPGTHAVVSFNAKF